MVGKWFSKVILGKSSKKNKDENPKQVRQAGSRVSQSPVYSVNDGYETSQHNNCMGNDNEDVDKAAEVFIHKFHRNLKLQKSPSEAQYEGYLARAT
ncbi:hypothetical protein SUGI_0429470 [Cryptomeria japonica]|nr:hypothetical protein SUGI_0429470 [Cryptomeria japonica]